MVKKNWGTTSWPCYIQIRVITRCVRKVLHCTGYKVIDTIWYYSIGSLPPPNLSQWILIIMSYVFIILNLLQVDYLKPTEFAPETICPPPFQWGTYWGFNKSHWFLIWEVHQGRKNKIQKKPWSASLLFSLSGNNKSLTCYMTIPIF